MHTPIQSPFPRARLAACAVAVLSLLARGGVAAEEAAQKRFATPEAALRALVAAVQKDDKPVLLDLLGPGSEDVVSSGDPVADANAGRRFTARAAEHTRFETLDESHVIAHVGRDDWPFPIPLVRDGDGWRFDTAAGREELLNRRIGRNELSTIAVCRAYVDAQREYASRNDGRTFAQKIRSDPGTHDGLYWEDETGRNPSPLGPLFAEAAGEGYTAQPASAGPRPYHGYLYRILTAQGANAPGGARSYVKDGRMTGGFALVTWPAEYGASGIMTFVVGPQGIVFQKNLGEKTGELAKAMAAYDPDASWVPVR